MVSCHHLGHFIFFYFFLAGRLSAIGAVVRLRVVVTIDLRRNSHIGLPSGDALLGRLTHKSSRLLICSRGIDHHLLWLDRRAGILHRPESPIRSLRTERSVWQDIKGVTRWLVIELGLHCQTLHHVPFVGQLHSLVICDRITIVCVISIDRRRVSLTILLTLPEPSLVVLLLSNWRCWGHLVVGTWSFWLENKNLRCIWLTHALPKHLCGLRYCLLSYQLLRSRAHGVNLSLVYLLHHCSLNVI